MRSKHILIALALVSCCTISPGYAQVQRFNEEACKQAVLVDDAKQATSFIISSYTPIEACAEIYAYEAPFAVAEKWQAYAVITKTPTVEVFQVATVAPVRLCGPTVMYSYKNRNASICSKPARSRILHINPGLRGC